MHIHRRTILDAAEGYRSRLKDLTNTRGHIEHLSNATHYWSTTQVWWSTLHRNLKLEKRKICTEICKWSIYIVLRSRYTGNKVMYGSGSKYGK